MSFLIFCLNPPRNYPNNWIKGQKKKGPKAFLLFDDSLFAVDDV